MHIYIFPFWRFTDQVFTGYLRAEITNCGGYWYSFHELNRLNRSAKYMFRDVEVSWTWWWLHGLLGCYMCENEKRNTQGRWFIQHVFNFSMQSRECYYLSIRNKRTKKGVWIAARECSWTEDCDGQIRGGGVGESGMEGVRGCGIRADILAFDRRLQWTRLTETVSQSLTPVSKVFRRNILANLYGRLLGKWLVFDSHCSS